MVYVLAWLLSGVVGIIATHIRYPMIGSAWYKPDREDVAMWAAALVLGPGFMFPAVLLSSI